MLRTRGKKEENVEWKKLAREKIIRLVSSELKVNAEMNTSFGFLKRGSVSAVGGQHNLEPASDEVIAIYVESSLLFAVKL